MQPYSDRFARIDRRNCLYSDIFSPRNGRKKTARQKAKLEIVKELNSQSNLQ